MRAVALAYLATYVVGLRQTGRRGHAVPSLGVASTSTMSLRMQVDVDVNVDVAVIGGGIAGTTISWLLQEREGLQVALIDPKVNVPGAWYPNYGEWRDEWHALSERLKLPELKECTTTEWERTDCFFGGSFDVPMEKRTTLQRPYVRVDRVKMQSLLRGRFDKANGIPVASKLNAKQLGSENLFDKDLVHDSTGSTLRLDDGRTLRCKILVDASGLESRLVSKEKPFYARGNNVELPTGFQIAYGFIAHTDNLGPYDGKAMTLFDYRTDHLDGRPRAEQDDSENKPTFMYAMPLGTYPDGSHRVFFEETSLVGRGARRLTFEECKRRALLRLAHHGINVLGEEEEEYCYIPMGGELPSLTQRVVAFGGAANMVHPSTGYHACRMLAASTDLAQAISAGIKQKQPPDAVSAAAYKSLWSQQNRGQRDFQAYGGDFLMEQPVSSLRGFFTAFFQLEQAVWGGFLAGWPGLPGNEYHETWNERLKFALQMFTKMPNPTRLAMVLYSIGYTFKFGPNTLLRSLTPPWFFFGAGPSDPQYSAPPAVLGDEAAKEEARLMMRGFAPTGRFDLDAEAKIKAATLVSSLPAPFNAAQIGLDAIKPDVRE